jgi:hypothetical protein
VTETPEQEQPLLRIVKGDPTSEEVAALVSVVSALAAGAQATDAAAQPRPEWGAPPPNMPAPHRHGPGAWRASAR